MWKLKDVLEGKVTEKERMIHFKTCFRNVHAKFLQKCPNRLYASVFKGYYALMPRARKAI